MSDFPTDPELLRQCIYDAGRSLGRNDPFLASELTDSVVHFLEREFEGQSITPSEMRESVTKIIGELGHPQLALAIQDCWPGDQPENNTPSDDDRDLDVQLCDVTLKTAYPSSIVAAHELGLIEIMDLDLALEMVGGPASWTRRGPVSEHALMLALAHARERFGRYVELNLAEIHSQVHDPAEWMQILAGCLDLSRLRAYLHLPRSLSAAADSQSLFDDAPEQPLFDVKRTRLFADDNEAPSVNRQRLEWMQQIAAVDSKRIRPVVHVDPTDFDDSVFAELIQLILAREMPVAIAFSRADVAPWRVTGGRVACPGQLVTVRTNLPSLITKMSPTRNPQALLGRVGGLVRLAHAAGRAKQSFLRRHGRPALREGFILERSAVVIQPIGVANFSAQLSTPRYGIANAEAAVRETLATAAAECSAHGPPCLIRLEPQEVAVDIPLEATAAEAEELCVRSVSRGEVPELIGFLRRIFRETRVSTIWLRGGDSA